VKSEFKVELATSATAAEALSAFLTSIWQGEDDVTPFDLILAAVHVGGYAALAKHEDKIVGASFGFLGDFAGDRILHSHVTGASMPGAGLALKMHQRAWAADCGLTAITWTFDPLVRRNCVFNFEKLGAFAVEYLPNFYGTMTDVINSGDESDRLFAYWPTDGEIEISSGNSDQFALRNIDGVPVLQDFDPSRAYWIDLPADIEGLRHNDLATAKEWRVAVRELMHEPIENGWFIRSISSDRTAVLLEPTSSNYELGDLD
jgi:predicted GNAT superfamily acetyltransferase